MARVRGDPITTALAHPTRRAAYLQLAGIDEMSTVQLQAAVGVDRYNLYHHLKKLKSLGLVENHRDAGRARWWRMAQRVALPELLEAQPNFTPSSKPIQTTAGETSAALEIDEEGRDIVVLQLEGSRDQVSAKQLIERLANEFGLEVDLSWNFIPEKLVLYSKKR